MLQLHLTGGEPLARKDLEALVAKARALDLYVNLITSGVPLARERLEAIARARARRDPAQRAGRRRGAAAIASPATSASTTRCGSRPGRGSSTCRSRSTSSSTGTTSTGRRGVVALGERLGAHRIELANVQYLGWALPNRAALLPSAGADRAGARDRGGGEEAARGEDRGPLRRGRPLRDLPARVHGRLGAALHPHGPDGTVLPCHAAMSIPGLAFESVRAKPLAGDLAGRPKG